MDGSVIFARLRAPNLIHASLCLPESSTQTASRSVQPFLHSSQRESLYFTMGHPFPLKIAPSRAWGIWTPSNTWFPGPTRMLNPNDISIVSAVFAQPRQSIPIFYNGTPIGWAVFAGPTTVTDQQTDRPTNHATRSLTIGRIDVRSTGDAA